VRQGRPLALAAAAFWVLALIGCGTTAATTPCAGNVAIVNGADLTTLQYEAFLKYTLGFYEHGNTAFPYYGQKICGSSSLRAQCKSLKQELLQHMIDEATISNYATKNGLLLTPSDWNKGLMQEQEEIHTAGGSQAYLAYLAKIGTDQAEARLLEGQQLLTQKVRRAIGLGRFSTWLSSRERAQPTTRCKLP